MSGDPAARSRGRVTRLRLAVVAVVVLAVTIGAVTASRARGHARPAANAGNAVAGPAPSVPTAASLPPSGTTAHGPATEGQSPPAPAPTTVRAAPVRSPAPPDSAVDPDAVFVDPAATVTRADPAPVAGPPRCADWRKRMTAEQRTDTSAALLRAAWQNEGSSATPPEKTIRAYASAISSRCAGKSAANGMVADVARAVFAADPDTWGP